jgi:GT2 family glycosyltransferase
LTPGISVVIPARGPAPGLEACLEALQRQTLPPLEVVVVDNGLLGRSERVRAVSAEIRVVPESREGSYAARNAGIRATSGERVAFTDADCIPDPRWLEAAGEAMEGEADLIVAGAVDVTAAQPEARTPAEALEMAFAFPQESYVRKQGFGVTANLMAPRTAFSRAGLFREDLLSGGDFEWGRRASAAGFRTVFAPGARVSHPARRQSGELLAKERRVTQGVCHLVRSGAYGPDRFLGLALWTLSPPLWSGWRLLRDSRLGPPGLRFRALRLLLRLRWTRFLTLMNYRDGAGT